MKNLTLRQIRIFICVAKHLSFTRAADDLHITASAVSLQIKEMEQDIGAALFSRENRKVTLTLEGEHFLIYAIKIVSTLEQAHESLNQLRGTKMGTLHIGLVSTTRYFFPTVLVEFQKIYPNVQIKVDVKNRAQLIELLHEGNIDVAFMGKPSTALNARAEKFANHPHVFIASPKHPLAFQKKLAADVLNREEIISREQGSGTRYILEKYLSKHNLSPQMRIEISGNETIKQAVIANLGVSFVSLHTISQEVLNQQLTILDIEDTPVMREWYIVTPNKREASLAAEAFRKFTLDKVGEILNALFAELPVKTLT